ncbi:techylectin-5A-like [Homarus americanus]|uniref:Ficolin-1-like 5 n=1 Tax=Homarus americanus TaxID=6706 RepID=A0A8J5JN96_HOMAM|nr:techylectin-5A-like [Homarus americanus]KAG7159296.1 ficolin-1-like 5 [Homarus americanus]
MTRSRNYQLRMDVKIGVQSYRYSLWSSIVVESEVHKYRLNLGTYLKESTTRLNCLSYAKSKFFSTFDRDHDSAKIQNCADTKKGGWWYNRCSSHPIPTTPFGKGQVASSCFTKNTVEPAWIQLKLSSHLQLFPQNHFLQLQ